MNRRDFIISGSKATLGVVMATTPLVSVGRNRSRLTILFTNDWHSRIEPFPMDGGRYQGLGGASKRAALIESIRKENKHTLLVDSGDIFQGTPYFNFFGGRLELELMSKMKYDVATLGNHDFDNGINGLVDQLPYASFPFVNCNYTFTGTQLENIVEPYKIFKKGNTRIGVLGIGIELDGLVSNNLFGNIQYNDPIHHANTTATLLKNEKKCDLVICLSHLGFEYKTDKVSDITFAKQSKDIDLILGGHTHTFLEQPVEVINNEGKVVNILQTGWAGINLGKIDYEADSNFELLKADNSLVKIS